MSKKEAGNTILLTISGSHGYGTNTEDSDIDMRGIFIANKNFYIGLHRGKEQIEDKENDTVIYEIRKFFSLATKNNPNILELLWMPDYVTLTEEGKRIIDNRDIFLSKLVFHTFSGYALMQLHKIKMHKSYLDNNIPKKPDPQDYGITPQCRIGNDEMNAISSVVVKIVEHLSEEFYNHVYAINENGEFFFNKEKASKIILEQLTTVHAQEVEMIKGITPEIMETFWKLKAYKSALIQYENYKRWDNSRNPKRRLTEEKFGYDTKHALHLVRLLRMAEEILLKKILIVKRPDAEELLSIKSGAWSFNKVMDYTNEMQKRIFSALEKSTLPSQPDRDKIEKLLVDTIDCSIFRRT